MVLFFYPAAMTTGCTKESCHFRDLKAEFEAVGAQRVGISADTVDKQAQFADKHDFDYPLLSDPDRTVAEIFGVKRRIGILKVKRSTFVIDTDRTVFAAIHSEVNMNAHADKALEVLRDARARLSAALPLAVGAQRERAEHERPTPRPRAARPRCSTTAQWSNDRTTGSPSSRPRHELTQKVSGWAFGEPLDPARHRRDRHERARDERERHGEDAEALGGLGAAAHQPEPDEHAGHGGRVDASSTSASSTIVDRGSRRC